MPGHAITLGVQQDATIQDRIQAQQKSREVVASLAADDLSETTMSEVVVRNLMPWEDFESGADNGWNGTDAEHSQGGLSSGYNEVYSVDSDENAENKAMVIYGVSDLAGDTDVTEVRVTTPTGATIARIDLSGINLDDDGFALFDDALALKVDENVDIEFYSTEDTNDEELKLEGAVAEKVGETVDESKRFLSKRG